MLLLLKPWRNVQDDLKQRDETWEEAFDHFMTNASASDRDVIVGIQYYYACRSAAEQERRKEDGPGVLPRPGHLDEDDDLDMMDPDDTSSEERVTVTEESLAELKAAKVSWREVEHGWLAVQCAKNAAIFSHSADCWLPSRDSQLRVASRGDIRQLVRWHEQMNAAVKAQNDRPLVGTAAREDDRGQARVDQLRDSDEDGASVDMIDDGPEEALPSIVVSDLRPDQRRAYNIIIWHLDRTRRTEAASSSNDPVWRRRYWEISSYPDSDGDICGERLFGPPPEGSVHWDRSIFDQRKDSPRYRQYRG